MLKLASLLLFSIAALAQQPSWYNLNPGCTYGGFSSKAPPNGSFCVCTNCDVTGSGGCTQVTGESAIATYINGTWQCQKLKIPTVNQSVYLWAHSTDDDQNNLRLSYSRDMSNWQDINRVGSFNQSSMRDPSVTMSGGVFYFTSSPSTSPATKIPLWSSTDLVNFSAVTQMDVVPFIGGATAVWAPEFFHDPVSGNDYILAAVSSSANPFALDQPFGFYIFRVNLATKAIISAQLVTVNGTIQGRIFDMFLYYKDGTYNVFYVDQSPTGDASNDIVHQYMAWATSNTLTGPYTQQTTAGTDYFGVTDQIEGMSINELPNGCVRMTYDYFDLPPVGPGSGGRRYTIKYKDSCASPGNPLFSTGSLGAVQVHKVSMAEHGTILSLVENSTSALKVTAAANYTKTDSFMNPRFGVNDWVGPYTFNVKGRAAAPGFIQNNEAVTIGVNSGGGDYATLTSCGSTNNSCALPFAGAGRWSMFFKNDGDMGHLQLSNQDAGAGENSIMFGSGVRQFGKRPLTVSRMGDKALWTMGSNNPNAGLAKNNKFFLYNRGIGLKQAVTGQTISSTINNITSECWGARIVVGASNINVTHLGRWVHNGNLGNHMMYLLDNTGAVLAKYTFGGSDVALSTAGADGSGYYVYTPLTNGPLNYVTLTAGGVYFIMSKESNGGDIFADAATGITLDPAFTSWRSARQVSCGVGAPIVSASALTSAGPVDLLYTDNAAGGYGGFLFTANPSTGAMRFNWGITFGSGDGSSYADTEYANIDTFGSIAGVKRINMGDGLALGNSNAQVMAGVLRAGTGDPPNNYQGWFQNPNNADTNLGVISNNPSANSYLRIGLYNGFQTPYLLSDFNGNMALHSGNAFMEEFYIRRSSGAIRANWGIELGAGTETGYAGRPNHASIDAFGSGSSGVKRINMGTGTLGSSDATVLAKAIDLTGYIGRRGGANSDLAGFVTLDGAGVGSHTFTNTTQMGSATCVCTVNSSLAACQNFISGSTLQLRGPAGANVTYVCIGAEY